MMYINLKTLRGGILTLLLVLSVMVKGQSTVENDSLARVYFEEVVDSEVYSEREIENAKTKSIAPNDLPVPWYSQKIDNCTNYSLCGPTSVLMLCDYFKLNTERSAREIQIKIKSFGQRLNQEGSATEKPISICGRAFYDQELLWIIKKFEKFSDVEIGNKKDYKYIKSLIDKGYPVMALVRYGGSKQGMIPGKYGHWVIIRGMSDSLVWLNDPGRDPRNRVFAENCVYPIQKTPDTKSYFDGCFTGKYIVIKSKRRIW